MNAEHYVHLIRIGRHQAPRGARAFALKAREAIEILEGSCSPIGLLPERSQLTVLAATLTSCVRLIKTHDEQIGDVAQPRPS